VEICSKANRRTKTKEKKDRREKLTYKLRSELSPRRVRLPTAVNWLWLKSLQNMKKKHKTNVVKKNERKKEKIIINQSRKKMINSLLGFPFHWGGEKQKKTLIQSKIK
jgi:hypothetical protein